MITFIGWITIILMIISLGKLSRLYYIFVLLTPYSAATVFIITNNKAGLPPSFLVGIFFIIATFLKIIKNNQKINTYQKNVFFMIVFFIMFCLVSIFIPILHQGVGNTYTVMNAAFEYTSIPSLGSFSQFIYLIFYLLLVISIFFYVDNTTKIYKTIKFFLLSSLFTVLWGIFIHQGSNLGMFEYPYEIFNNHPGYYQGYDMEIYGFVKRMSSVAQEPSVYSFFLGFSITLLMYLSLNKVWIFTSSLQIIILILHVVSLFLTTSSTAIVGFFLLLFILFLLEFTSTSFFIIKKKLLIISIVTPLILFLFYSIMEYILTKELNISLIELVQILTINKLDDGTSGDIRVSAFFFGLQTLIDTYFLGAGYGINRTFDINTTLLANIGFFGFLSFLLLFFYPFFLSIKKLKTIKVLEEKKIYISILIANILAYILMSISIPDFVNTYFWLFFALMLSIPNIINKKSEVRKYQ